MERCECCQEEFPRVEVVLRSIVLVAGTERLCRVCAALIARERVENVFKSPVTAHDLRAGRLVGRLAA